VTVSFRAHVARRSWRGYDDPGLPVGSYITQGAVTGNMSGGNMLVIFEFREEGQAASGRFYNIEQMEVHCTADPTRNIFMQSTNFDIIGAAGLINRNWAAELENNANGISAMVTIRQFPLPIFLGIAAPVPSLSAQVEVGTPNIDLEAFTATLQGYIWEPRSVLSEGGLRRPLDSLYGAGKQ